MADPIQTWIDELKQNRLSAKAQPLVAVVDDVVLALQSMQLNAGTPSLLAVKRFFQVGGGIFNYSPTPGALAFWVRFWGTGGGGGGAACAAGNCTLATSGGAGAYSEAFFLVSQITPVPIVITLGAPGVGGDATGTAGTQGAPSSFGGASVPGGLGGIGDAVGGVTPGIVTGANGGSLPPAGFLNIRGGPAGPSFRLSGTVAIAGTPGVAPGRDGIRGANVAGVGSNGTIACGGSAGCCNGVPLGRAGGNGGDAECFVFEFGA